jgi:hypothetical protein
MASLLLQIHSLAGDLTPAEHSSATKRIGSDSVKSCTSAAAEVRDDA